MKTFLVELTVSFDDDENPTEKAVRAIFEDIDPSLGIVVVENIQED